MNETRQLIDYIKQKNRFRFDRDIARALGVDPMIFVAVIGSVKNPRKACAHQDLNLKPTD